MDDIVPKSMQRETLSKIHQGHQGIEKCHLRVLASVWWPGVSRKIQTFAQQGSICRQQIPITNGPIIPKPYLNILEKELELIH